MVRTGFVMSSTRYLVATLDAKRSHLMTCSDRSNVFVAAHTVFGTSKVFSLDFRFGIAHSRTLSSENNFVQFCLWRSRSAHLMSVDFGEASWLCAGWEREQRLMAFDGTETFNGWNATVDDSAPECQRATPRPAPNIKFKFKVIVARIITSFISSQIVFRFVLFHHRVRRTTTTMIKFFLTTFHFISRRLWLGCWHRWCFPLFRCVFRRFGSWRRPCWGKKVKFLSWRHGEYSRATTQLNTV